MYVIESYRQIESHLGLRKENLVLWMFVILIGYLTWVETTFNTGDGVITMLQ
jgi:hypothetical protein